MPANLTPPCLAAEQQFKEAKTPDDKPAALRQTPAANPKPKGAEKLPSDIERRIQPMQDERIRAQKKGRRLGAK